MSVFHMYISAWMVGDSYFLLMCSMNKYIMILATARHISNTAIAPELT